MSKKIIALVLAFVMVMSLAVFAHADEEKPLKIGFANYDVGNTWCTELAKGVKDAAEKCGAVASVDYCSANAAKQVEVIENYITMGYDVIMLVAVDVAAVEEPLKRAQEAGIFVIASAIETTVYDV